MRFIKMILPAMFVGFFPLGLLAGDDAKSSDKVELKIALPQPLFVGTPKDLPAGTTVEKPTGKPRPALMVPKGVELLSLKKPVKLSDDSPVGGTAEMVTDGAKEGTNGAWLEMASGLQWAQIDLQKSCEIYAIVIWHYHAEPRVYRDVVVQIADDPDFIENVRTVFNNDQDNSAGLGLGKDREYFETSEGKLIEVKGLKARYVRCYSKGSTADEQNHYVEVEVFGRPGK